MKLSHLNLPVLVLCTGFFILSCEPETPWVQSNAPNNEPLRDFQMKSNKKDASSLNLQKGDFSPLFGENLQKIAMSDIPPSECSNTEFSEVQWKYFSEVAGDQIATNLLNRYLEFNHYAPLWGIGSHYFGENGEYTRHVLKVKRDLERFWNTDMEIQVLGQHSSTLNDPDEILEILWRFVADVENKEDLLPLVKEYIEQNNLSNNLPENPLFSSEGYSNLRNQIVLGDGLIRMFSETGIDPKIVWTGILSHEWTHQIQINYFEGYDLPFQYIETRVVELEADFMSGYYMTHKRGATYNWKRVEQFFSLFYQAGDCAFENQFHHGTPQERMAATRAGYELAASAQKKGKILSIEQMHEYFLTVVLPEVS